MKILTCFLFSLGLTAGAFAADRPSGRIDYATSYVPFLHGVLMYGGWAPPKWVPTNEGWLWDGSKWSRLEWNDAPAFAHHTMAFDTNRDVLVVCGRPRPHEGSDYQIWEYGGKKWERKGSVPVSATALGDPKLTYDSERRRLVLYVALTQGTAEIWEFAGSKWQPVKPVHQPMRCDDNGCEWRYDLELKKSVLVGEERSISPENPLAWDGHEWGMMGGSGTQTWLWDGSDWSRLPGPQPPRALWGGMTYDIARHQLLLLTTRMETWTLHGSTWKKLNPQLSPHPAPNGFFSLEYEPLHKTSLFFGGESRQGEAEKGWAYPEKTWLWDGKDWTSR